MSVKLSERCILLQSNKLIDLQRKHPDDKIKPKPEEVAMKETSLKSTKKRKVLVMPTEVYSRIVGYYRPVQNWNDGKKQEFKERKYFRIPQLNKNK